MKWTWCYPSQRREEEKKQNNNSPEKEKEPLDTEDHISLSLSLPSYRSDEDWKRCTTNLTTKSSIQKDDENDTQKLTARQLG